MDEENYKAFLAGDSKGFEKIVLTYKDNLIYFLNRYVNDLNQAEDLAQDAFVEIYIHKERFNFKISFKTYLFTIGRNKAVDYIRKAGHQILTEKVIFSEENRAEERELEDKVIAQEEKKLVNQAMKQLKKEYEEVLDLIYLQDMSHKEAAMILGKNIPQIKVLAHRGRKALGKILEKEGYVHEK